MEILFVSHKFPPAIGGMEKQSYELITGMERYAKVHRLVYDGSGSIIRFFYCLKKNIIRICKENPRISVIHFNDGLITAFCARHKGYEHLKRTATLHGLDVVFPSNIYHCHILPRFNNFDKLIAVSQATAESAISLGIHPNKLTVIHNGVDVKDFRDQNSVNIQNTLAKFGIDYQNQPILVAMGRPVRRKGFSWFIKSVVPLLKGEFLFLLIGPYHSKPTAAERFLFFLPKNLKEKLTLFLGFPSDTPALRTLLVDPEFSKSVKHLGRLHDAEVKTIFAAASGFVMPNIQVDGDMEGFGLVCLEAVIAGVPVFAADIDGIPDAIRDGKNGYLLPSGDPEAWAQRLNVLLANPKSEKLNVAAFRAYTIENYNWEKMTKAYYELFKSL
ncbi:glycosyltransferase family 4 protein [Dyadobacter luticola]|uniref:Glycosyltransferase family 4 protein n=1 Tax=Dyadobacter luticola TaxID=1979387 RepID=A0A5R9L689_9BACT|nr:glycosyltransferase family 4 protein [Dyadobacter luticola]